MEMLNKILALIGFGASKVPGAGAASGGNEVMQQSPDLLMATQVNYQYNRNTYRTLINFAIVEAGIILVLIFVSGWIIATANPQDRFFMATVDGRISRVIPLDTPTANNNEMYSRVGTSVAAALTFGFLDFEQRKIEMGQMFEPAALNDLYVKFFGATGLSEMNQNNHVFITAVEPSRPGGVISQNVQDNIYRWVIQVPLLVTRKIGTSEEGQVVSRWTAQVLVQRAKAIEVPRGFITTNILALKQEGVVQQAPTQVQGVTP